MKKWWKNGWKVRNIIVSIHDFSLRTWRCQTYHVCFPSKNKCSKSLDQGTVLPMMMFLEGSKPPATAWRGSQVGVDVPFLSFWGLRCRSILISCEKKISFDIHQESKHVFIVTKFPRMTRNFGGCLLFLGQYPSKTSQVATCQVDKNDNPHDPRMVKPFRCPSTGLGRSSPSVGDRWPAHLHSSPCQSNPAIFAAKQKKIAICSPFKTGWWKLLENVGLQLLRSSKNWVQAVSRSKCPEQRALFWVLSPTQNS